MYRAWLINHSDGAALEGDRELMEEWDRENQTLWLDIEGEDKIEERALLHGRFGVQNLAIDDAHRARHPPKLEWFDDHLFMLLKGFTADTDSIDFGIIHISFFCGRNLLVTRHDGESPSINTIWRQVQHLSPKRRIHSGHLMYKVVRTIINRYSPIVLNLEKRLDELEEDMVRNASDELLEELISYNSRLRKLRRIFGYQQNLMIQLKQSDLDLHPGYEHEFQDAFEQMERLESLSGLLQSLVADLINGYISVASHRLNNIMKTLTVASVVFLPLTFVAGIYGMNFTHMPELQWHYGYFAAVGVMAVIATTLLVVFWRKRWI